MAAQPPQSLPSGAFPPPAAGVRPGGPVVNSPLMRGSPRINSPLMARGRGAAPPAASTASPRSPLGAPPMQPQTMYQPGPPSALPPGQVGPPSTLPPGQVGPPATLPQGQVAPPSALPGQVPPPSTLPPTSLPTGSVAPPTSLPTGSVAPPTSLPTGSVAPPTSLPTGPVAPPTSLPPLTIPPPGTQLPAGVASPTTPPPNQLPHGFAQPQPQPGAARTIVNPALARGRAQPTTDFRAHAPGGLSPVGAPGTALPPGSLPNAAPPVTLPASLLSPTQPPTQPAAAAAPTSMPSPSIPFAATAAATAAIEPTSPPGPEPEASVTDPSMKTVVQSARKPNEYESKEDTPDRDAETRTLCDYMIQELESGIRMQRTSDYKDMVIKFAKEGTPSLVMTEPTYEGLEPKDGEKKSELLCEISNIESVTGKPDPRSQKFMIVLAFKPPSDPSALLKPAVTFQCKDKNAYVNMVDGIGALLGRAPRSYERTRDIQTVEELFKLAQIYGPPALPPLPQDSPAATSPKA